MRRLIFIGLILAFGETALANLATAIVIVADIDVDLTRPALPDDLKPKTGSIGIATNIAPKAVSQKPTVQMYVTAGCPPCGEGKRGLTDAKIPFVVMPKNPAWAEANGYPSFAWKVGDNWFYHFGWPGREAFERYYNSTFRVVISVAAVHSSDSHWTYPGDIGEHLVSDHGYSWAQVNRMTQEERLSAHDAAHEKSRKRRGLFAGVFGSRSSCPGGRCP